MRIVRNHRGAKRDRGLGNTPPKSGDQCVAPRRLKTNGSVRSPDRALQEEASRVSCLQLDQLILRFALRRRILGIRRRLQVQNSPGSNLIPPNAPTSQSATTRSQDVARRADRAIRPCDSSWSSRTAQLRVRARGAQKVPDS